MFDWNDLRFLLATARHGSTLKASAALGVNQTTVARRIKALETALGAELFQRRQSGYVVTEEGRAVLDLARSAEDAATRLEEKLRARRRIVSGKVRITGTEYMARVLLAPALSLLRAKHPDIAAEIIVTDQRLDLGAGEADIALRAGGADEQPDVVRRRMPDSVWAIYMARSLADERGMPEDQQAIRCYPVIVGEGVIAAAAPIAFLERSAAPEQVVFRSNSLAGLLAATEAGIGLAALPAVAAANAPSLVRCAALPKFEAALWLCWHETRRNDPLIRAVIEVLAAAIASKKNLLSGM
jgi:DNA-binding transcriptional LysR family regulator